MTYSDGLGWIDLDDSSVFGESVEHDEQLKECLGVCRAACPWIHSLNEPGTAARTQVKDYEEKVILEITTPVNVKGVRSFLGYIITSLLEIIKLCMAPMLLNKKVVSLFFAAPLKLINWVLSRMDSEVLGFHSL